MKSLTRVNPIVMKTLHCAGLSRCVLRLLALPVSNRNIERAFAKLGAINQKERGTLSARQLKCISRVLKYMLVFKYLRFWSIASTAKVNS